MKGIAETDNEPGNRSERAINRDMLVFAFFLFLSFIFWYLNSLNKTVETGIKYPIRYSNVPKSRSVTAREPAKLSLYVKGTGSSVLKLKLSGNRTPVSVDLSKVSYSRVLGSKDLDYYIISSDLQRTLSSRLKSGCEIISIKPDTLFFTFGKRGK